MAEATDVYADQFQLNLGPLGCTLNFQVSGANPVAPGTMPPIERVATIRCLLYFTNRSWRMKRKLS
jgi:hypothetical protein